MYQEIADFLFQNPYIAIIGVTCVIQIAPIKLNPWTALAKWLGNVLSADLQKKLVEMESSMQDIETKLNTLTRDVEDERVQRKRWSILDFANTCRQGVLHTKEEWDHCLHELEWYENYITENNIPNGVIRENSKWLTARYQDHMDNDDFLKD